VRIKHCRTLSEDNETLRKDNETLCNDNEGFRKDNETLCNDNEGLRNDNQTLCNDNESLRKNNESLCNDNQTLCKDNEGLGEGNRVIIEFKNTIGMKKIYCFMVSAAFCGNQAYSQNTEGNGVIREQELAPVEIVGYMLRNISYTDSMITVGAWNNLRLLDIPYSLSTLTSEMMKNLQVSSLNEVSKYMPSMQIEARGGLEVGRPQTRGFQGSVVECSRLDGLNIVSTTAYPMEQFDRFEVLNGIAGSLYGPASPAGAFNYSSKRVKDAPVNDVSASYQTLGVGTFHADLGRRYAVDGERKSFGFRANALYADGEGFAAYSSLNRVFVSGAFDARYNGLTIETHLSRYRYRQFGYPGGFSYGKDIELPKHIDPTRIGYGQEWAGMDLKTVTADANIGYAFGRWQITGGVLSQTVDRGMLNPGISLTGDDSIGYTLNASSAAGRFKVLSNRIAANGVFNTGTLRHNAAFGTSGFVWSIYNANSSRNIPLGKAGIYTPSTFPRPEQIPPVDGHYKGSKNTQQSIYIGDDIAFGRRFSAVLSLSYNLIDNESYTRTGDVASSYRDEGFCYSAALRYKPLDNMSLYGTYNDVIQQGAVAPTGAANENELLDPYRCKQYEAGCKISFPGIGAGVALFDMTRPFPFLDPADNVYKLQGVQENKGVELYGDAVVKRLHALGGITFLRPRLKDTGVEATSNTDVVGVPKVQANLFVEYRIAAPGDLSVNGNLHHTGAKAANDINTAAVDRYTTIDLGLRYTTSFLKYRIIWNLQATNLFNAKYWASIFPGSINGNGNSYSAFLGSPREIKASVRVVF
jgi:iron complex outermembrane receptor protein